MRKVGDEEKRLNVLLRLNVLYIPPLVSVIYITAWNWANKSSTDK